MPTLVFDLTGRGELVLSGKDRAALLHGLLTNDVNGLKPGTGCYAALLTPKGKMQADLTVLCHQDRLVVDCEPELVSKLARLIPGYVFFQEVLVEDRTLETAVLHLCGRAAAELLSTVGLPVPSAESAHAHAEAGSGVVVVRERRTGADGFDLRVRRDAAAELLDRLSEAGAAAGTPEELESARIAAGIPRWGAELDESVLPNEARLERNAISYNKGCYMGQEIVARIRTYGHVNRLLVGLTLPSDVARGAELRAGDALVGRVTSATRSARGGFVALGYLRREHAEPGTEVQVEGAQGPMTGTVVELPVA